MPARSAGGGRGRRGGGQAIMPHLRGPTGEKVRNAHTVYYGKIGVVVFQPLTRLSTRTNQHLVYRGVLGGLLHRRLIYEQGRAETPGRPILYGTSMEFMERFGLTSLDDLPPLEVEIAAQLAQAEADAKEGVEESPRDAGDGATSGEETNDGVDVAGAEEEAPPARHDTAADG